MQFRHHNTQISLSIKSAVKISATIFTMAFCVFSASGQSEPANNKCGTDSYLQSVNKKFPGYKDALEKANQLLNNQTQQRLAKNLSAQNNRAENSNAMLIIPVVFHIVLPDMNSITDAEVQYQIDVLNRDFAGSNADSINLAPMFPYSLRGHTNIRFCIAQKDSRGNLTTGIERRCSNIKSTAVTDDPVKQSALGGLDSWDPSKYFNVWVSNSAVAGLLGYATYPFSFTDYAAPDLKYQGVVITKSGFGNSTSIYAANRGRTLVHETGHYFGLFHTFEGGCASQDFSLSPLGASTNDDTPPQSNPTTGRCPAGKLGTGCANATDSSRLYQNYMDYTDDACLTMFTMNQVARMETALNLFRSSLTTSDGCSASPLLSNEISLIEMLHPFGGPNGSYFGCNTTAASNIYCASVVPYILAPVIRIRNTGSNPVNEMEIWYKVDEDPAILNKKVNLVPSLGVLTDTLITFSPINFSGGAHELKIFTQNPNSVVDSKPGNDTVTANLFIDFPSSIPIVEGFEGTVFPPAGWKVINSKEDNVTWQRTVMVKNSGLGAAFINLYNYETTGGMDNLISPSLDIRNSDSILVSFSRAYRQYSLTPDFVDSLELLISEDCGSTFKTAWKRGGAQLTTNPAPTGFMEWFPIATDWRSVTVDLKSFVSPGASSLQIGFRTKNGYGQNFFLDDINIRTYIRARRDAAISKVAEPFSRLCSTSFKPSFVISNAGTDTLTTIKINYAIDGLGIDTQIWNGILLQGQTTSVSFAPVTVSKSGNHTLLVYTSEPNNSNDQRTSNDSVNYNFTVFDPVPAPIKEGFETASFPPANWDNVRSNNFYNWERTTKASTQGIAAAWMRNRLYNGNGAHDVLYTPSVQIDNADSVFVKFDLAYATLRFPANTGVATDTLEVLLTKDCGQTFTSIYKKWGENLQTTTASYPYSSSDTVGFVPVNSSQWRTDSLDISAIAGTTGTFQLAFRNINNNANNIFLDNIRINQVTLPAKLKSQGYLVLPNPSAGLFFIRHYLRPVNLKSITVFNTGGQAIWSKQYNGDALSDIPVDLSRYAAGLYFIRLMYTDRMITQRIIKTNK